MSNEIGTLYARSAYKDMLLGKTSTMSSSAKAINIMTSETINRVPESYFYVKIFPIVRDWLEGRPNENTGVWFNAARAPTNELIVVDDDTLEEVFRCPPATLLHSIQQDQPGEVKITLDMALRRQDGLLKNGNIRGVMEIEGALGNYVYAETSHKRYLENLKTFLWIYERYELTAEDLFGSDAPEVLRVLAEVFPETTFTGTAPSEAEPESPGLDLEDYDY